MVRLLAMTNTFTLVPIAGGLFYISLQRPFLTILMPPSPFADLALSSLYHFPLTLSDHSHTTQSRLSPELFLVMSIVTNSSNLHLMPISIPQSRLLRIFNNFIALIAIRMQHHCIGREHWLLVVFASVPSTIDTKPTTS